MNQEKPELPIEKIKEKDPTNDGGDNSCEKNQASKIGIADGFTSKPNFPPAKSDHNDCDDKPKSAHARVKFWFEMAGIVAGAVGVVFLILQYHEMAKATKATLDAVKVSQGQLAEMKKARISDERAWVAISDIVVGPIEDGFVKFIANYKNTGKTPAINTQIKIVSHWDIKEIAAKDSPPSPQVSAGLTAPGGTGFSYIKLPVNAFKSAGGFYLYGTVWYDDIFGKQHWSQFCYTVTCSTNFSIEAGPAAIHNSCDDAENANKD